MATEFAVRFKDAPGIVDSEWLVLSPGISVLTGRDNVGKSRLLTQVLNLQAAINNAQASAAVPIVRVAGDRIELIADVRGSPPPALWEVRDSGDLIAKPEWSRHESGHWSLAFTTAQGHNQLFWGAPGRMRSPTSMCQKFNHSRMFSVG